MSKTYPRIRDELNAVFAPVEECLWEELPPAFLVDLGFHRNTMLFFSEKFDALLLLLWRKEPSNETFLGNFPCAKQVLDWMPNQLSLLGFAYKSGVKRAFVATIESARENQIINFISVEELIHRLAGIQTFLAPKSGDEFYWLDEDLHPVKFSSKRRPFRQMKKLPLFMQSAKSKAA
jgi:hypothetical protein